MKSALNRYHSLGYFFVLLMISWLASPFILTVHAAGNLSLDINITGNPATVDTNEIIEYVIDFSCAGTTGDCGDLTIDFPIDPDTDFIEVVTSTGYTGTVIGGNIIRITDTNPPFNDGDASQAIVRVRARVDLIGGEPIDATITGTITDPAGPPTVNQSAPTVVVNPPTEQWSVIKTQTLPATGIGPAENGQATYQVQFCPDSTTGNILLDNVTMVDTYPPGVVVISTGGGIDDGTSITWNLGNLTPNDPCQTRTVVLEFPNPPFSTTTSYDNLVEGFGENINFPPSETCSQPNCIGSDTFTGTIDPPESNPAQGKSGPGSGVIVSPGGGSSVFTLSMNTLSANVPTENVILVDTLPKALSDPTLPAFELVNINSGQWGGGIQASVEYSTNDGVSFTPLGTVDGSVNTIWNATTDFPLAPPITDIRWVFDPLGIPPTLPPGFSFSQQPSYRFIPHPNLQPIDFDDGTSTPPTRSYSNCVSTTYTDPATSAPASSGPSCASVLLSEDPSGIANVIPSKSVNGSPVDVLDSMDFTLTATLTQEGSGAIINPSFEDILPSYLTLDTTAPAFVATFTNFTTAPPQPYLVTQTIGADTQLVFYWDDVIRPGSVDSSGATPGATNPLSEPAPFAGNKTIDITFTVDVALTAPAGQHDNGLTFVADSPNLVCQAGTSGTDGGDIDSDTDSTETTCNTTTQYEVREAAAMISQKWDRSVSGPFPFLDSNNLDNTTPACPSYSFGGNTYTRFPCVAQGTPGGAFEAAYTMQNAGLVRVDNYIMYDVLPHIGDTGVAQALASEARESEFTALLTGPVAQQNALSSATFIIEYNTDPAYNGCRPEMSNNATEAPPDHWQPGCNNTWVDAATIGAAWDTVTAFRIRQTGGQIEVGETMVFLSPLEIIDYNPPINDDDAETGEIAWNSFAQRFNNFESGSRLLTAEPRKVGIIVEERYSIGNRVWLDEGDGGGIANNGILDGTEVGIDGVTVELLDSGGTVIGTDITHQGGYYIFDDLDAGTYTVRIPASQFVATAPLEEYISSTGNITNNVDSNDNGIDPATIDDYSAGIVSNTITLSRDSEPINEADLNINGSSGEGEAGRGSTFEEDEDSDLTIDFGFYRPMSIGNRVWFDTGAGANTDNGIIDADETGNGVDGVLVNLYYDANEDGAITGAELTTPVASDTTANGGYYLFDLLQRGNYLVQIDPSAFAFGATPATDGPLARYITSTGNTGDTQIDSDDNGIDPATEGDQRIDGVFSELITLELDLENDTETDKDASNPNPDGRRTTFDNSELTVDFGFFQQFTQMSLGNRVWIDDGDGGGISNDGIFNGGEVGIDGVVLNLYLDDDSDGVPDDNGAPGLADDIIDTQTTANGGLYLFDTLDPGRYIVQMPASNWAAGTGALENYFSSTPTNTAENVDNNDNGIDQATYPDYVANGLLSATVQLVPQGEPIAGDDDDPPLGIGNADGDNNSDNTVDFGFYKVMSIGNRVWLDNDNTGGNVPGDGIFDSATENGIDGVLVELYLDDGATPGVIDGGDTFIGNDTTTGGGYYLFDGLSAADYIVRIPSSNFDTAGDILFQHFSSDGVDGDNTDDGIDNDDNGEDDLAPQTNGIDSEVVTLTEDGEVDTEVDKEAGVLDGANVEFDNSELTVDFGFFVPPMSIGNRVWFDTDADGIFEPGDGEVGIDNVTVELFLDDGDNIFDAGDTSQGTTLTASDGYYLFDNIPPGTYFVRINGSNFGTTLLNHISTVTDPTPDDDTNFDDNGQDPAAFANYVTDGVLSNPITLAANSEPTVTDEPGTDFNGRGTSGEEDIDSNLTVDFGFYIPMSIGNQVWLDDGTGAGGIFNNAMRDGTEAGIAGVTVNLLRDNDGDGTPETVFATTVTDADGYYLFDGLPAGDYQISIPNTDFDAGGDPLFGLESSTGNTADDTTDLDDNGIDDATPQTNGIVSHIFNMALGTETTADTDVSTDTATYGPNSRGNNGELDNNSNLTLDFGFNAPPTSLGNRVWYDNDSDGLYEPADGEVGIDNVTVELFLDDGDNIFNGADISQGTTITASDGYYLFDNLPPATYFVRVNGSNFSTTLQNYISTLTDPTPDDTTNLDDNGQDPAAFANYVTDGVVSNPIPLAANTEPTVTDEPVIDFNGRGISGEEDDHSNLTVDFGFYIPMSIGNQVWLDDGAGAGGNYNNALRDGTEAGIAGVTLNLLRDNDGDGTPETIFATTTTDADGFYLFDGLPEGDYQISIPNTDFDAGGDPLFGLLSSNGNTADDTTDLNDNGVDDAAPQTNGIVSNIFNMALGTEPTTDTDLSADTTTYGPNSRGLNGELDNNSNLTLDFGFNSPPMSIGNLVWIDVNNSGTVDAADGGTPGQAGITVSLYDDTDGNGIPDVATPLATDTTDANGYYLFENLVAGNYVVGVDASNFATAALLEGFGSSTDSFTDDVDSNDNGVNDVDPANATFGILSNPLTLTPNTEPTTDTDVSNNVADGPNFRGNNGEADNNSDLSVDFGFFKAMSLGNRLWFDTGAGGGTFNDGIQNGTEAGVPNAAVTLYLDDGDNAFNPATDTVVATDTTDAGGFYLFDGLIPGNYFVWVDDTNFQAGGPLEDTSSSSPDNPDNSTDLDDNGVNGILPQANGIVSTLINLAQDGEVENETDLSGDTVNDGPNSRGLNNEEDDNSDLTVDFGFIVLPGSIGNRVWYDVDNSALIDAADGATPGLPNVTVQLYLDANDDNVAQVSEIVATDVTDANGYYLFDGLPPGNYFVGLAETNFRTGGNLIDYISSTGSTATDTDLESDDNGVDSADPAVGGILSDRFVLQPNTEPIAAAPGPGVETDYSNNPVDGPNFWGNNNEEDDESNLTVDFGLYKPMSVGNRVWFDVDDSSTINGTETGVPNVVVNLYQDTTGDGTPDTVIATDTTDASGYYLFDNLLEGTYFVEIENTNFDVAGDPLFGLSSSTVDSADDTDSNDNGINDAQPEINGIQSNTFTLTLDGQPIGESDLSNDPADGPNRIGNNGEADNNSDITIDFGFVSQIGSIGNRVWLDNGAGGGVANNGLLDGTEPGIENVAVSIYRDDDTDGVPDGAAIATDTTDVGGYYLFDGLAPGNYIVGLDNSNFGAGQALESLISSTGNVTDQGATNDDSQDNGIDTPDATFGILSTTMNLTPNAEAIGETDLSNNPADGPNFRGNNGEEDDDSDLTVDFGLYRPISLGNRVWFDTDDDGTINGSEIGIGGVAVSVYLDSDGNGVPDDPTPLATDTTDANGYYLFEGLVPGTYVVAVDNANFGASQPLESLSSSTGNTADDTDSNDNGLDTVDATFGILSNPIVLTQDGTPIGETDLSNNPADGPNSIGNNGENDTNSDITVDFGFTGGLMSLGNRVWVDETGDPTTDRDGILNGAEVGVENVEVSLYLDSDTDGVPDGAAIATDTTNVDGYYLFDGLAPGNYIVGLDDTNFSAGGVLIGYTSTTDGTADTDSQDNGVDGNAPEITGILSNTVALVMNTEPTTDTDLSNDPADGPNFRGNNGEEDDDSNLTVDFGVYKPMSLGNRVWFDPDDNGVIDTGENGIANVNVTLFEDDGDGILDTAVDTVIDTDVTDGDGYYLFDNLVEGDYFVWVTDTNFQPAGSLEGFSSSTGVVNDDTDSNDNGDDAGVDGGIASDLINLIQDTAPTGETDTSGDVGDGPSFRGNFGESDNNSNLTIDFGFVAGAMSIGNRVWLDDGTGGGTINDGTQDGGEPGVANVLVNLYADTDGDGQPNGGVQATDTTSVDGYYLFDGRSPGQYVVQIDPSNFQAGGALFGLFSSTGDDASDTDSNDNGVDSTDPAGTGILSQTVTLIADNEPTGETDLSNDPADGPAFIGNFGETDNNSDVMIDFGFVARFDWGDAPDDGGTNGDYGTLDANGGPSHQIISTLFLGATIDDENDGQESVAADGDGGDEDGVDIPPLVAGTTVDVEITVFNDTGNDASLIGWFDFDGNGTFDPSEAFTITVPSDNNIQVLQLPVDVPIDADVTTGGSTYSRFRLTTDPITDTDTGGVASNGEVEDYVITVLPPGLSITKTDGQNSIVVGQETTYTVTINNSGSDVDDRNFVDNIPLGDPDGFDPATVTWTCEATGGASCIAGAASGTDDTGTGAIDINVDIPRDGQIVFTLTGTLNEDYSQADVVNTAEFPNGGPSATDTNGVIFDPPSGEKTGVILDGGTRIRWTMTWLNTGGAQAATVSDTLQNGQTFAGNLTCNALGASSTTSCNFGGGTVSWSGIIDTGNANRVEISFDVTVNGNGRYRNTATIDINGETETASASVRIGGGSDDDDDDDDGDLGEQVVVDPGLPPPNIQKIVDTPFTLPGATVNWTITTTNDTNETISDITIADNVPADLAILNSTSTSGVLQVTGNSVILTQASLAPGESIVIILQTEVSSSIAIPFVINNTAVLTCKCTEEVSAIASLISVLELPSTGQSPWSPWRTIIIAVFVTFVTGMGSLVIYRKSPKL